MNDKDDYHGHAYSHFRQNICIMINQSKNGMKHQHLSMIIASMINLETGMKSYLKKRKTNFVVKDQSFLNKDQVFVIQDSILFIQNAQNHMGQHQKSHLFKSYRTRLDLLNPKSLISQSNPKILIPIHLRFHPKKILTNQSQKQPWNTQIWLRLTRTVGFETFDSG